jgi:sugar O-acyltransferase (sialic acid O-acetyltransferase NeuD family)
MSERLLVAGAGGHGRVLADAALATGNFSDVAFLDDNIVGQTVEGWSVVGRLKDLARFAREYAVFAVGIGNPKLRLDLLSRALEQGFECHTIIHPRAYLSSRAVIADGCALMAGACVNVGARLGRGCIVNTGASVDHDCDLDEGVHVSPGAHLAGNVRIGARTWFGIGAVAKQNIRIGSDVTIGAGAVVVTDVPDGVTVVGNPARILSRSPLA